jgi:tetratricopeptide (TPR) repeat protein
VLLLTVLGAILAAVGINLWAWYHFREAGRLAEQQQWASAYDHYAQALRVWRWSAVTHFRAARTARRAELYPEAQRHLEECQRLKGTADVSVPFALEHLLLQAQSGDISEVEEALWKYVEQKQPDTTVVLEALARGYLRLLRPGAARRCTQMILQREPENVDALILQGRINESEGEKQEAIKAYRRALELDPRRDIARLGLAQLLIHEHYSEEARALFDEVLARNPNNREAMLGLARAQRILGEPEKARALLEAVLAQDPENTKALTELGMLAFASGQMEEAEDLFRKAIAIDPVNRTAHHELYRCLAQHRGREEEAAAQIDRYERLEADLTRMGQIASKEMSKTPNDPKLHYELGMIYLRYGKPATGLRWLSSALKLDPNHQPSHQALYDYFTRTGDTEKAEQHRMYLRSSTAPLSSGSP